MKMGSRTISDLLMYSGTDLPKDFVHRVRDSEAGKWANVVDQILYDMSTDEVPVMSGSEGARVTMTTVPEYVYVGEIATENKLETRKALREVFHCLEAIAFKEALR